MSLSDFIIGIALGILVFLGGIGSGLGLHALGTALFLGWLWVCVLGLAETIEKKRPR